MFGVIPFIKPQSNIQIMVKKDENWDGELNHLTISGWTVFVCPVLEESQTR